MMPSYRKVSGVTHTTSRRPHFLFVEQWIVTGGKLVNPTRNGDNQSGPSIDGGVSRKLSKGDFALVQEGVPHWFSAVDGQITLMSLHLPRTPAAK